MWMLILGLILFFGAHLVFPRLHARIGRNVARLGVTLLSFIGLALVIVGYGDAATGATYSILGRGAVFGLAHALMPIAVVLVVAAQLPNNIKRYVSHPMSTGVALWAAIHLLARHDAAALALFGAFGAYGLFNIFTATKPARSAVPVYWDLLTIAVGLALYGAILWAHGAVGGVAIIGG